MGKFYLILLSSNKGYQQVEANHIGTLDDF